MGKIRYLLVADAGAAKLFRHEAHSQKLELIHSEDNPAGRKMASELESDRPGSMASGRGGYHGLGGDRDPHRHESEKFAAALADQLKQAHQDGQFDELMISAPPQFLGELRSKLSADCQKALARELNKDLIHASDEDVLAHFT